MRLFLELARLSFQRQLAYRAAAFAGLATNFFFGLLRAAVLIALYGARQEVNGMTLQDAITFTGVSQATIAYLSIFNWYEIIRSVHTGAIASDLLKPMDFFRFWLAQDFGRAAVQVLLRGLTILALYTLFFDISFPQQPGQWAALVVAVLLSWVLSFAWRFLLNLPAFWVPNAAGIARMGFTLSWFLSGFMMPLRLLPEPFVRACYLTPFPHMVNTVIEIYLGLLTPAQAASALLNQALWAAALIGLGQAVLRRGVRRLVIQGG
jgi:ABC-2 type transport system permease protein